MSSQALMKRTGERLGLSDELVLKKAEEYSRVLYNKASVKALSDGAKIVLCLDLASANLNEAAFDKATAIKLSGLKRPGYEKNLHTIEKILALDKPLTVSELCVQFSCMEVKELAEEIFSNYKKSASKIKDLTHPQYVVAAIYTACRIKNVKTQKSQFIAVSRLKPSQWKELLNEFEKFTECLGISGQAIRGHHFKLKDTVENLADELEHKIDIKKEVDKNEVEDYEVWKKRILDEAYAQLRKENMNGNIIGDNDEKMEE